jgi:integrase
VPKKSRFPILRSKFPRVVDYRTSSLGRIMVDGRRRGSGKREYFKSVAEAKTRADQLSVELENHGTAALTFPARDREMAVECRDLLKPFDYTIRDATRHFLAHLQSEVARAAVPLIRDCVVQYLIQCELDGRRGDLARRSLIDAGHCAKQLSTTLGDVRIADFDTERLKMYVDSFPVSARTRSNLRLRLSRFLSFCKSKKWITANPAAELKIRVPRVEIAVFTVNDAERLLRCAEASPHRSALVPYVALCMFGGLRPFEAQRLDWSNVDFDTNHVHVLAHTSKKREGRYVSMEPALVAWLKPYALASGPVVSRNHRKQWEALVSAAGYSTANPWPVDVMRHTAASMLLVVKQNRALVAEELGTSVQVLRRHYRKPIQRAEAERFWSITPSA